MIAGARRIGLGATSSTYFAPDLLPSDYPECDKVTRDAEALHYCEREAKAKASGGNSDGDGQTGTPSCVIDYTSMTSQINEFNRNLRNQEFESCDEPVPLNTAVGRPEDNPGCEIVGSYGPFETAVNQISQARFRCRNPQRSTDPDPADSDPVTGAPTPDNTVYPGTPGDMYAVDPWEEEPPVVETLPESKLVTTKAAIGVGVAIIGVAGLVAFVRRKKWKKRRR